MGRDRNSYLMITKEHYSDGVKEIYEKDIKANSLTHAKEIAAKYVEDQINYLRPQGYCYLIDIRRCKDNQ